MDLLDKANEWLNQQRIEHLSQTALYIRGGDEFLVYTTAGRTDCEVEDESGLRVKSSVFDFIIAADELLFPGGDKTPSSGDRIRIVRGDKAYTYEVMELGSQGCWKYSDSFNSVYRIHTRLVDTEVL